MSFENILKSVDKWKFEKAKSEGYKSKQLTCFLEFKQCSC
jgi:hypothetical protein